MPTEIVCNNPLDILVEWCSSRNQTAQTKRWWSTENLTMSSKTLGRAPPSKIIMVWCSSHEHTEQRKLRSTQGRWAAPSLKRHVDRFHNANHHLSTRTSRIMVVRCSLQKPIQYEYSKDHHWDLLHKQQHPTNATCPTSLLDMNFFKCHCGTYVSRNHTVKHLQKKNRWDPFHEKGSIKSAIYNYHGGIIIKKTTQNKCSNARQEPFRKIMSNKVSEVTSLKDHGGVGFITRPYSAHIAMFITGTCSATKRRWLATLQNKKHVDGFHVDHH